MLGSGCFSRTSGRGQFQPRPFPQGHTGRIAGDLEGATAAGPITTSSRPKRMSQQHHPIPESLRKDGRKPSPSVQDHVSHPGNAVKHEQFVVGLVRMLLCLWLLLQTLQQGPQKQIMFVARIPQSLEGGVRQGLMVAVRLMGSRWWSGQQVLQFGLGRRG